ncbi:tRNA pseudouridine(38-40) synthase TruA [Thermodesulfobacteriota bacterium]
MRFKAVIEYDGTAYHGWQLQKNLPTIQGKLEEALARILRERVRIIGAGRTDAGVHAFGQTAHFTADWSHDAGDLHRGFNALLPPDIAVKSLSVAALDFHARHSAYSKVYIYRILNRPVRSPVLRHYAWHIPQDLNLSKMVEAARSLLGAHDFCTFGSPTDGTTSTVRKILKAEWERDESHGMLSFTICGTGFLRYMVRSLVGTLARVGREKITPHQFNDILIACDRSRSGPTAPPNGLFLDSVQYGESGRRGLWGADDH